MPRRPATKKWSALFRDACVCSRAHMEMEILSGNVGLEGGGNGDQEGVRCPPGASCPVGSQSQNVASWDSAHYCSLS